MQIKTMLVQLQNAMGRDNLVEKMILIPEPKQPQNQNYQPMESVNLIVGYNGTPTSQTALDITLWMAHQIRLLTQAEVTVQVVYVLDNDNNSNECPDFFTATTTSNSSRAENYCKLSGTSNRKSITPILTQREPNATGSYTQPGEKRDYRPITSIDPLEKADHILWQARCLAEEWRGSFKAHLRFGCIATEIKKVLAAEAAALLFLGCHSAQHPIVQQLGHNLPCPVLGIPNYLD